MYANILIPTDGSELSGPRKLRASRWDGRRLQGALNRKDSGRGLLPEPIGEFVANPWRLKKGRKRRAFA